MIGSYKDFLKGGYSPTEFCGIIVQTPDFEGLLSDYTNFFKKLDQEVPGIVKIIGSDLFSLSVTRSSKSMGADICYGSSQRFGVQMGFGGPYSGFFATKKSFIRKIPGRIIGISKDV